MREPLSIGTMQTVGIMQEVEVGSVEFYQYCVRFKSRKDVS